MNHIRLIVTATALVVAIAVAAIFVLNGSRGPSAVRLQPADGRSTNPSVSSPSPSANPTAAPSAAPTAAPSPAPALAGFTCGTSTVPVQAVGSIGFIGDIRTGAHTGYDRLVIEFASGLPGSITITPQQRPTFTNSPRGDSVTLGGAVGLHVVMHDADAHTSFSGPATMRPNGPALVEVRRLEDFEGYVGLGLGLAKSNCYRAFMLTSPTRLVIDVQVV